MRHIKKILIPFIAILLAMAMLFTTACNPDNGGSGSGGGNQGGGSGGGNQGGGGNEQGGGNATSGVITGDFATVTFMVDNSEYKEFEVEKGSAATRPANPGKPGQQFTGWYEQGSSTAYNFSAAVTDNLVLYAKFTQLDSKIIEVDSYNESLYVIWSDSNPANAKVEYRSVNTNAWTKVDSELVRANGGSSSEARVDILGLAAGNYDVKITPSGSSSPVTINSVNVAAYDRSGYAHFKYTDGIGAYNDDGTLKENALVIYVTNENKDTVMKDMYETNPNDIPMFKIPYCAESTGGKNWNKNAEGIGWWLNNNQYTTNNAASKKKKVPSNTYDATNGGKLGFKSVDRPIAIRIIGTVETPEGLTCFNDVYEGGSVGDNGHMARMKNLKNITIEGVGDDAMIHGWGFHFICGTDATNGQGKSFEVRNLTFYEYPEDAIGMEGQQSGSSITASVERCWIHNNTFLPGHCESPAESDKKEGDGSVDFKRGMYFTASYNWYEYCHKTNLVGSADDSLQYNLSYHHNVWWQCGSRIPLLRQANAHFYNNYVMVDQSETTTPYSWVAKPSPSYVHSLRANCYMFSEANYYDGCKNLTDGKNGGAAKSWNNIIYGNSGTNTLEEVTSREQKVPNKCAYSGTDYSSFDTNPDLFYYNNYHLDYATTARQRALMFAGANGHGLTNTKMNKYTPANPVVVDENSTTITLPTTKSDTEVNGVMFRGLSGVASGTVKFKGQGITFTLAAEAQLTVETTTTGDPAPELFKSNGLVYAHKFTGKLTVVLPAGTYVISSGQKEKEAVISSLKFDSTSASSAARVEAAVEAINALVDAGNAQLTEAYEALLNAARSAYNALTATEKSSFNAELYGKLQKAIDDYGKLQIAEFNRLVELIGTVTANSYDAINAAQQAYDKLTPAQQSQVTSSKATLDAAWTAYDEFAVTNVINLITAYVSKVNAANEDSSRETIEALIEEGDSIVLAYLALDDDKEASVTNYAALTTARATVDSYNNYFVYLDVEDYFVEGVTITVASTDSAKIAELTSAYNALTATQKAKVEATYRAILAEWDDVKPSIVTCYFTRANGNSGDAVINASADNVFSFGTKHSGADVNTTITTSNGQTVEVKKALKMESSTELNINLSGAATVIIYMTGNNVNVDGTKTNATSNVITVDLASGKHVLTKADSTNILYIEVIYK